MRWCALAAVMLVPTFARGDDLAADDHAVAIAAELGAVSGGGATPGGLHVGGHYLYRLSARDWFDGSLGFTYGGAARGCGGVAGAMVCDHGVTDGFASDLALGVRRDLGARADVVPFVRAAVVARILRFASDDITGYGLGGALGAGLRIPVRGDLAIVGAAEASAGLATLDGGVGRAGQFTLAITAAAELRTR